MISRDNKEELRKELEKEGRKQKPSHCGNKMKYKGFVFFDDPCFCGSGKKFKECCYRALPKK